MITYFSLPKVTCEKSSVTIDIAPSRLLNTHPVIIFPDKSARTGPWKCVSVDSQRQIDPTIRSGGLPRTGHWIGAAPRPFISDSYVSSVTYSGIFPRMALHNLKITFSLIRQMLAVAFPTSAGKIAITSSLRPYAIGVESSLHHIGLALDIYVPDVTVNRSNAMLMSRIMAQITGCYEIGYYPDKKFFHIGIHPSKRIVFKGE